MYQNIMFDLDGTVTDSGRAIMLDAGATYKADSVKEIAEILGVDVC